MPLTMDAIQALSKDEMLALIMEEAAELIHAASKARRFGCKDSHPTYNGGAPNFHAVIREAVELNNLCRAYCAAHGENWGDWSNHVAEKAQRQRDTIGAAWVDR
jgi:hypothetical protein